MNEDEIVRLFVSFGHNMQHTCVSGHLLCLISEDDHHTKLRNLRLTIRTNLQWGGFFGGGEAYMVYMSGSKAWSGTSQE